jgi:crotonobetainyl-CoA:carnitine CoA-transferase CaiB-like acyl-CoA transferase
MTAAARPGPTGPLAGFRIVDMTSVLMGPFATQILGDYGADVVKVETEEGDLIRLAGAMRNPKMGALFLQNNRNKRSVVLDLKAESGRRAILKLCERSDVFVSNVRPAAMKRLGLTYEDIKAVNPAIVYASLVGYGQAGPYADRPAYDDLIQGISALPSLTAAQGGRPQYVPLTMADRITGLNAVHAILAALLNRERTGAGQSIEIPMFEVMTQFVLGDHFGGRAFDPPTGASGYNRLLAADRRPYETADGFISALVYTDAHWRKFFQLLGRSEEFHADARFHDHATRARSYDTVYSFLAAEMRKRTTAEWMEGFARLDIPFAPMHSIDSLLDDPHLQAVGLISAMEHPTEGTIMMVAPPASFSRTPPSIDRHPPRHGEHTMEVLQELGYASDDIRSMVAGLADAGAAG